MMTPEFSRRDLIGAIAAVPLAPLLPTPAEAQPIPTRKWSVPYGAAVRGGSLTEDAEYRATLAAYCDQLVSEGGLKWFDLRPTRDRFDFSEGDRYLAFARANGMKFRGHTLVWHGALPPWAEAIDNAVVAEREMIRHIETVVGHYRGKIANWDVVNEAIADDPQTAPGLRDSLWLRRIGPRYVALALRAAAQADPGAKLIINDYDIEFVGDRYKRKREAFLRLIRSLRADNVPLHGVGLQGHLSDNQIDQAGLTAFASEIKAMGLEFMVTELDVVDNKMPGPPEMRDMVAAARVHDFLGAIFAAIRPSAVLTWGITDKYSWVPIYFKRGDGLPNRPLPFDVQYKPKPMMQVIEHFCR